MKRPQPHNDAVPHPRHRRAWPGWLAAALLVAGSEDALAQAPGSLPDAEACLAANRSLSLGAPLPRTTARLSAGEPVRIIAIGSSSTTGLWMLSPSTTYPEVMRRELARLRPAARIEIINSGRVGDTVTGSIARLAATFLRSGRISSSGSSGPMTWPGADAPKGSKRRSPKASAH